MKLYTKIFKSLCTLLLLIGTSALANQQSVFNEPMVVDSYDDMNPRFGVFMGAADPEGDFDANEEFGLSYHAEPFKPVGFGALITYSSFDDSDKSIREYERTAVLGSMTYNLSGSVPIISHMYGGLNVGPIFESNDGDVNIGVGSGPIIGADFPLTLLSADQMSLGAMAHYLVPSTGSEATLSFAGHLQYWY